MMRARGSGTAMAYSDELAERIRELLAAEPELREQKMFGGIAFMLRGNMCCGVHGNDLIVRVGPEAYGDALAARGAREFDLTGRPMSGWVMVEARGVAADAALASWVERGRAFALTLPAKR